MIKFEKVKPGQILYDVHSERLGNTTLRRKGVWEVRVISVDTIERTAMVSWNGNPPKKYYESAFRSLRANKPKKLNGHLEGCPGYGGALMWGERCKCKVEQ